MVRSNETLARVIVALTAAVSSTSAFCQTVTSVTVAKTIEYRQTSANTGTVINNGYGFYAGVSGIGLQSISAPLISGPIFVDPIVFNGGRLLLDPSDNSWQFGRPNSGDRWASNLADLNSRFGSGIYSIQVANTNVALNLTGDLFPANTPLISFSSGTWTGGVLQFDPKQSLTITTSLFSEYGSHLDNGIAININRETVKLSLASNNPSGNFMSYTIPANTYTPGQSIEVGVDFASIADRKFNPTIPSSDNFALYDKYTTAMISAVPEVGGAQLLVIGLAALAVLRSMRKRADA